MGASFIYCDFPSRKTKNQLAKCFEQMSEQAAYDHGHEYSGSWNMLQGILFPEKNTFESKNKAEDWVSKESEKWGPALCVKFKDKRSVYKSPPTFEGKSAKELGLIRKILLLRFDYTGCTYGSNTIPPIIKCIPADQLTAEEAASAIRLYKESHYSQNDKTSEVGTNARKAWQTFEASMVEKLWAVKHQPYTAWLMGGWAAE